VKGVGRALVRPRTMCAPNTHTKKGTICLRESLRESASRSAQSMESKAYRSRVVGVLVAVSWEGLILSQ
jgi:hypothetical protein